MLCVVCKQEQTRPPDRICLSCMALTPRNERREKMEPEVNEMAVVKFDITEAEISELRVKYMELTIKGMDDKLGFDAVHRARIDIKGRRVFVEKTGKAFREKAIKYQKDVITEEKRIIGLLAPIEDYLSDQENRVTEEVARIKAEAEAKIQAIFQARENRLLDMGCRFDRIAMAYSYGELVAPVAMVKLAPDDMFEKICVAIQGAVDAEKAEKAAEAERIAKITAEQEKERIRLTEEADRIKKEQDRIAAEQAKEREILVAEGKMIQDEKDRLAREKKAIEDAILKAEQDKLRAIELENAKTAAAEKARIETEERIKREAVEKEALENARAVAKAAIEEKARIAAERKTARAPDKVKILLIADALDAIQTPDVKTEDGKAVALAVMMSIAELVKNIREKVEAL